MPPPAITAPLDDLAARVAAGERRALARAITLVESTRPDHREQARYLLERLSNSDSVARRIGLSGTPGVGKSTFIEALGMRLIGQGHKVAVLAVDPSSARSGGSILGDKTRMEELSRQSGAFIRPSPSHGALGGVARRTRETIRLVEAAGFDTVLVETVGVGQSETMVAELTDVFLLLLAPAGGDELQGVKRGIMEIADLILVNKADGPLEAVANATRTEYAAALHLMRPRSGDADGFPMAMTVSAVTGHGLEKAWEEVRRLFDWRRAEGWIAKRRAAQAVAALERALEAGALQVLLRREDIAGHLSKLRDEVAAGWRDPEEAAETLIAGSV
ncbi:MAG: methylmalonyl Co-A mutase-associated GTPase MeaB [Pseudomonadota bacterium]